MNASNTGTNGQAVLGDGRQTRILASFTGVVFTSPTLQERHIFDLLDRGFHPQDLVTRVGS